MTGETPARKEKLESWKEIAAYLNRDVRTARRWEKDRGLPVRRFPGTRPGVYALVADIDHWLNNGVNGRSGAQAAAEPAPAARAARPRRLLWAVVAAAPLVAIALLALSWTAPVAPKLRAHTQVTHNGWLKRRLLRRGDALYYESKGSGSGMSEGVRRISAAGDEFLTALPPGPGIALLDVSPDGSRVLFRPHAAGRCDSELWDMPLATRQPHRIGQACVSVAAWSPDGARLAYVEGRTLYLAKSDGNAPGKLLTLPYAWATDLHWSPDGRRISLVLQETHGGRGRLWDVQIERGRAAPLLPGWSSADTDEESSGQWTAGGRFFVFAATHSGVEGIWAIPQHSSVFGGWLARPAFLTSVARAFDVTPGPGGKKVFAVVDLPWRGELLRLDPKTQQFAVEPKWGWLSGRQLAFSPDGRRVAYLAYPEEVLWTADLDGKNPHRLSPDHGYLPQWSPDGTRIAFMSSKAESGPTRIRITSPDGQDPVEPVPLRKWQGAPYWTSNRELVFGDNGPTFPIPSSCSLHVFDLKTGQVSDLPRTTGLWTARPCPTGRYIAAQTNDSARLMLYDRGTAAVTELFRSPEGRLGDNPTWSEDGAYIYMDTPYAHDPAVYRIRIADRKVERIASLVGIQRVESMGLWMGLTPDGALLILRQVEGSEIESWDWVAP